MSFLNQKQSAQSLQEQLVELIEHLSQTVSAEAAVAQLARSFIDGMKSLPDSYFAQLQQLDQLTLNSIVAKRQGMVCWVFKQAELPTAYTGYLQSGDHVGIQFPGNEIRGPIWLEPALSLVAETETFAVQALPNTLSDNAKLVLVRRLIRESLLKVVSINEEQAIAPQLIQSANDRTLLLIT